VTRRKAPPAVLWSGRTAQLGRIAQGFFVGGLDGLDIDRISGVAVDGLGRDGYQILLSTHDLAQAEFLQRKFAARKIPCATLSLLGTGREGVEISFSPATVSRSMSL
jgi:hypothetical protein